MDTVSRNQRLPGWRSTPIQVGVLAISVVNSAWALAGLIANPSFATGDAATSVTVLGIDFNGWHALSGLAVFLPGIYVATRGEALARVYALLMIPAVAGPGIWALLDRRPLGLWPFDHPGSDALLHFASATAYAAVLVVDWGRRRQRAAGAEV